MEAERQKAQEVGNAQLGVMVESRAMDKDGRFCSILINKTGIHLYTYYIYTYVYITLYTQHPLDIPYKIDQPGIRQKSGFWSVSPLFSFF